MKKRRVALFGASGTMGFQAFLELWRRRAEFDISILVLPSEQRAGRFRAFAQAANVPSHDGTGVVEGDGLRIVWGDATQYEDVAAAVRGADAVLSAMAFISPQADYRPELARAVNEDAVANIIRAIQAEPDGARRVPYVHTGTVAETGNRPLGIHMGRIGDPLNPSVFDSYALSKIAGERLVLESELRRWASLRLTFILPTTFKALFALFDPIFFHMPIDTRMESITDRDAGFALVNSLDVPAESEFWRRAFNLGGGPQLRTTAYQYLADNFGSMGLNWEACAERNWYALRNFHLQYYEDSDVANHYLRYQRDTMATHASEVAGSMPFYIKLVGWLTRRVPWVRPMAERIARRWLRQMAEGHRNSPLYWYRNRNDARIAAFFGSYAAFEAIPGWGVDMPDLSPDAAWRRLNHGYDEDRGPWQLTDATNLGESLDRKGPLDLRDLQAAAEFRGGRCVSSTWDGDPYSPVDWVCAFAHEFSARPYTVLGAGHWCPTCVQAWNGDERARVNPFFAQVWYADHDPSEHNTYAADCIQDIRDADVVWRQRGRGR